MLRVVPGALRLVVLPRCMWSAMQYRSVGSRLLPTVPESGQSRGGAL
jgi:hypothetical protein